MVQPPIWTYSGTTGPDGWAELDPANAACALGERQSPIDLDGAVPGPQGDLSLAYHLNQLTFTDVHRTLSVTAEPGGVMTYDGTRYDFAELHFHTPSEHTRSGSHADLEAHFVHATSDRSLAVIGVMFSATDGDHPLDALLASMPGEPGGSTTGGSLVDLQRLIPTGSRRFRYTGSLTTPPCSEGVEWIVMEESQPVGGTALEAYRGRYPANNRPVQPLNRRTVTIG